MGTEDTRRGRRVFRLETNLIADFGADLFAPFGRDPLGAAYCRQFTRLTEKDSTRLAGLSCFFEDVLRDLGRFSTSCCANNDRY